jgi:hypothetical protein
MPPFTAKYTDEQREAVAQAYEDRGIRPARRIRELAQAGELTWKGEPLEAFDMPEPSILCYAGNLRRKRAGKVKSTLADLPHRDAVESLRRRLLAAADQHLIDYEKAQKKPGAKPDPELLRQIARATREIAAMPGPKEPKPVAPGQRRRNGDGHEDGRTGGGIAGQILAAHRKQPRGETAQRAQTTQTQDGDKRDDAAKLATYARRTEQTMTETGGPDPSEREHVGAGQG